MRERLFSLSVPVVRAPMSFRFLLFFVVLFAVGATIVPAPARALDVKSVRFGTHNDRERVVIELSSPTQFRAFVMQDPNRLIIDTKTFDWDVKQIAHPPGSIIRDVRYGALGGGQGRIVLESTVPVLVKSAFLIEKTKGNSQPDRIVIDFAPTSEVVAKETSSQVMGSLKKSVSMPSPAAPSKQPAKKTPVRKKLVIIDPGHGGQDPGAIGVNGMYEKTIVLAVGLELRRQLEDAGYSVAMTRSTDVFIPLRDRVKFARKKGGDLFISLHSDSVGNHSVTGASVYTLSDKASDKETEKLAERENKSDLIAGIDLSHQEDDVAGILIDLAARDTMNQSRFLAKTVLRTFNNTGVNTLDGNFRSAGFAVLKAMDIPSILVEMGYLTNRSEVEKLSSPDYRRRIAASLKRSVDDFFKKNE